MENEEEKDVLIFDTGGGWNGTVKKEHVMCLNTQTTNKNFVDSRIRVRVNSTL